MAMRIRQRPREFDEPPREKRIRGGETQYPIKIEHLTKPFQRLVTEIHENTGLKMKMLAAGVAGAAVAVTAREPVSRDFGLAAAGAMTALSGSRASEQHGAEKLLAAMVARGAPVIKEEFAELHARAADAKWKSSVIPIRGGGLKLSTQKVFKDETVAGGTDPFLLKTCDRIAFRPQKTQNIFGTDEEAEKALLAVIKETADGKRAKRAGFAKLFVRGGDIAGGVSNKGSSAAKNGSVKKP